MSATRHDLPTVEADSRPYWNGARAGRLMLARCRSCERLHHYPRTQCPFCWSQDVEWADASGDGTLYTYSTVYMNDLPPFSAMLPYVAAVVELAEGPRLMTNVVGCDPEQLRIGMPLRVDFRVLTDDVSAPVFRPVHRGAVR